MAARKFFSVPSSSPFYPVSIPYSCRFDSARSCYLSRTPGGAGNRQKWTWGGWVKLGLGTNGRFEQTLLGWHVDAQNFGYIIFDSGQLYMLEYVANVNTFAWNSPARYRDYSNWVHVQITLDTTQAALEDRIKVTFNGTQITGTGLVCAQNSTPRFNDAIATTIGRSYATQYGGSYLSDVYFIDGTALALGSFGEFSTQNSAVWIPKTPTGLTYGTNGFHLDFANAADLGNDVSGNNNDYTSSGLTSADQFTDTPTNNVCVLNALTGSGALSEGNLKMATGERFGTFGLSSGKWSWKFTSTSTEVNGIEKSDGTESSVAGVNGKTDEFILDLDAGTFSYIRDGSTTSIATGLSGMFFPLFKAAGTAQFSGYTPASGYKLICTSNMTPPVADLMDSSKGFDAKLYTGTGSAQNITSFNFQPDLTWIKNRSQADSHMLIDSVRGATKRISSNLTDAEATDANGLTAFLTNGFTLGTGANGYNDNTENFVSWCWKKSATYGMDIVSYTGNGANRTIAHGLGAVPEMMIVKNLDRATNWPVQHKNQSASPAGGAVYLNATLAFDPDATMWNSTPPTSSVFSIGTSANTNLNTERYIAYLFRSVPGFSAFGSYTGNGNADGPFVYCGFRPKYVLAKPVDNASSWFVFDAARDVSNPEVYALYPNATNADVTYVGGAVDFTSNGFKLRTTNSNVNGLFTYIFAAFAEAPFPYNNAR